MAPKTPGTKKHSGTADTTQAVETFMGQLDHPFKTELQALRQAILGADPAIAEGIKWHAPSFRTTDYFATTNLREKAGIGVILHLGAKARDPEAAGPSIKDPDGLLRWLAKDRAAVVFKDLDDFNGRRKAFTSIIRQWIAYV